MNTSVMGLTGASKAGLRPDWLLDAGLFGDTCATGMTPLKITSVLSA